MCGRYSLLTEKEIIAIKEIIRSLGKDIKDDIRTPKYQTEVYPTDIAPIMTIKENIVHLESAKWGFKTFHSNKAIINARYETIAEKYMFKNLVFHNRCIIPAPSFFEWAKIETKKVKYLIKDQDDNLLFFAGLYRINPDNNQKEYVIITKEATGDFAKIHNRVPLILRSEHLETWLNGNLSLNSANAIVVNLTFENISNSTDLAALFD